MFWLLFCVALIALFYFCVIKPFTYWSRQGVPQKAPLAQWLDIIRGMLQLTTQADIICKFYNDFPGKRYVGGYQFLSPVLYLRDPELIKQITVKDFDHFVDHNQIISEDAEPLFGKNLFSLKGDRWRDMRATLSPSFTSSKMRDMFAFMTDCALQFVQYYKADKATHVIEMKDAFSKYTNDVIASTAFGITCDTLRDPNNEFYVMGKRATGSLRGFWQTMKLFIIITSPKLSGLLGLKMFSKEVSQFFRRVVETNIESREKTGIVRPDMIHLLMEAKKGRLKHENETGIADSGFSVIEESSVGKEVKHQKAQLTNEDLTAQAFVFFFAGFEAVSTLMSFMIYEIAVNPDIQETLHREIDETLEDCGGTITYEGLLKMKYLDMVVSETLRKWMGQVFNDRICVKPYIIPPVKEGEVPIRVEEAQVIMIPIFGIHRSSEFYSDPERFDPERFSDENRSNINPYTYLPFGVGPRSCIGNRFALLETKTVMFHILYNFEICVTEKTTVPLRLARDSINPTSADGFWFGLKPRNIN